MSTCTCGECATLYWLLKQQFDDVSFRNVCQVSHWHWVMDFDWYHKICQVQYLREQYLEPIGKLFGLEIEIVRGPRRPCLVGPWLPARTIEPLGVAGTWAGLRG